MALHQIPNPIRSVIASGTNHFHFSIAFPSNQNGEPINRHGGMPLNRILWNYPLHGFHIFPQDQAGTYCSYFSSVSLTRLITFPCCRQTVASEIPTCANRFSVSAAAANDS